ncbi:MAG TPA: 2-dehydropantoate 2-reductase [Desulfobulbaceae bacterium]|nr:2-dehydropantoate 2-reductase [Desulfobulbaceae bacterium]
MHIVLVGPGALGTLLSVRLAPPLQEKGDVLFLLDHNPERARKISRNGLALRENNHILTSNPQVTADPRTIPGCDILLLCVKAGDVTKALQDAAPLIANDTLIVGMQNGMGHLEALENTNGIGIAAVSSEGATLEAPGKVIYGGSGITRFGLLSTSMPFPESLKTLVALFIRAGLQAELVRNIQPYLWEKLFVNVGINALTAIYKRKNGHLLTSCSLRSTMKKAIAEAVNIAEKKNIHLTCDPIALTFSICRRTKNNVSSMLQDVYNKRPTEINAINGYIVSEGKRLGIPTPVNANLMRRVREIERYWPVVI